MEKNFASGTRGHFLNRVDYVPTVIQSNNNNISFVDTTNQLTDSGAIPPPGIYVVQKERKNALNIISFFDQMQVNAITVNILTTAMGPFGRWFTANLWPGPNYAYVLNTYLQGGMLGRTVDPVDNGPCYLMKYQKPDE